MTDLMLGYFRVTPARGGGYIAWAAKTPELGEGPDEVPLGEIVYYLLEDTEREARQRLQEVLLEVTN